MSSGTPNIPQQNAEAEVKRLEAELAAANERWKKLAEEYSENEGRQRVLAKLTYQLSATRSEKDAARLLESACRELFDFDSFLLDAYDAEWEQVRNILCLDVIDGVMQEVPADPEDKLPGPLAKKVIAEGAQLILRKPEGDEHAHLIPFGNKSKRSLSLMFAPVRNGDKILGTLSVQSYRADAYMQSDLDLLQVTADLCGGAFDRILTEQEMHAKEAQYHQIVECTQEGIWLVNSQGQTTFVNRRMAEMLGYEPEEMLGATSFDFMFPEDRGKILANIDAERRKPHRQLDLRLRRKDGEALWALVTANPILDAQGKFTGSVGLLSDITERKRVEEELRESEARFQAFMNNLAGFAFIKDPEGRHVFVNSTWERLFGHKLEAVRGMTDDDLFTGEMAAEFKVGDARLRAERKPFQAIEVLTLQGETRSYFVSKFLIPGEREGEELIGGVAVDVTERLKTQEALRESQAMSQAILGSALDAVVTIGEGGSIVEFNQAAEKMFGRKRDEVLGLNMAEVIVPPEMRGRHQDALKKCVETGESRILGKLIELQAMRADGSLFPVELTINRVEHGPRLLFTGFIRDISERKAAEAALRLSEERYRTLMSASVSVVWTTNAEGEFDAPQPSWGNYTGQSWEQYRGFGWAQAIEEADREVIRERWKVALEKRQTYTSEGRLFCAATKSHRHFTARGIPLLKEDGSVREWIGTVTDIEDQKCAELERRQLNVSLEKRVAERTEELEATNKELESFCYSVSHDLRAPLRAIDGFSQALAEDYAEVLDESGRNYLDRVRKGALRMARLIDDLLELSRIGRAELMMQSVDLSNMAKLVAEELQHGDPERQMEWSVAPGIRAWGDSRLMRVALDNLLGNAWKFTRHQSKPRIEFGVTQQASGMVYFVRDNGAGFDMKYSGKLFGVFQRLHSANEYEGTGVGLANVQRVVHRHGGQIWAEAKVDEGATFYFTLPEGEKKS